MYTDCMMDPETEALAEGIHDFEKLGVLLLNEFIKKADSFGKGTKLGIASGPISTGGVGSIEGNLTVFEATIERLECLGIPLFSQMSFEKHMIRIVKEQGTSYNPMKLLEGSYSPIFRCGRISMIYLIHGWNGSFGARWERGRGIELEIPRVLLPKDFHLIKVRREMPDHTRGLCGKPDVGANYTFEEAKRNPPYCLCCRAEMKVVEASSAFIRQLGAYLAICPICSKQRK